MAERRLWSRVAKRWRKQEGLDLEGMQTVAREAEREWGVWIGQRRKRTTNYL